MTKNSKTNISVSKPQPTFKEYNDYTEYTRSCNELAKVMSDIEAHAQFLRMTRDTDSIRSFTKELAEFQSKISNNYSSTLILD